MSSELTPELELFKAVPGSGEPFRTSDLNDNADKVDAAVVADRERLSGLEAADVALDGRLDAVEADNWVTQVRIADGAVGVAELAADAVETAKIKDLNVTAGKLAADAVETAKIKDLNVTADKLSASLDLTGKTVDVATQSVSNNTTRVASTAFVKGEFDGRRVPRRMASGILSGTLSNGKIGVNVSSYGFTTTSSVVVTATLASLSSQQAVVGIDFIANAGGVVTTITFSVLTSAGATATGLTFIHWQAIQAS